MKNTGYILSLMFLLASLTLSAGGGIKLPEPDKITFDNGMTVFLLEDHELPIVNFNLLLPGAGTAFEDRQYEGLSDLITYMLLKGTKTMSADQISEELDFMGATLDGNVTEEYALFRGYCLSEHLDKLIGIAADSLINPAFKEDEFKQEIPRRIDRIATIKDSPFQAAQLYFQKAYFGDHPMGNLAVGNEESFKRMSIDIIKTHYKKYYRPDTSILAIVGNFDSKKLIKLLKNTLGKWEKPASPAPKLELPPLPKIEGKKFVVIDKPDATQTYFVMGAPGFRNGDPVLPSYRVANTLFGGRFTSWMSTELRIKRGLTYNTRSSYSMWKNGGVVSAASYTQNKNIALMLDITFDLLKKAHNEGFVDTEVESARNYIMGQFPPTLERAASKTRAYVELSFYNLGFDYYNKVLSAIEKVTKTQADEAAKNFLPLDNYILVLVGKLEQIKPLIGKFGTFIERKIADPGF
jgi:predicted Zn-dependent peptidase